MFHLLFLKNTHRKTFFIALLSIAILNACGSDEKVAADPLPLIELISQTPSNNTTPRIRVSGLRDGAKVEIYYDNLCANKVGTITSNGEATLDVFSLEGENLIYIKHTDTKGNIVSCLSSGVVYELDTTAPEFPILSLIGSSPSNNQNPSFSVSNTEIGWPVFLYSDNMCSSEIASLVVAQDPVTIQISTALDSSQTSYIIYSKQIDIAGNESICSSSGIAYELDLISPVVSGILVISVSPSINSTVLLRFSSVEIGAKVVLYSDQNCSNELSVVTESASNSSVNFSFTLSAEGTYAFYSKQVDLAGNSSNCTDSDTFYAYYTLFSESVAMGRSHSCTVLSNQRVKCWGRGHRGQLGQESSNGIGGAPDQMGNDLSFIDLGGTGSSTYTVSAIATGEYHNCVILSSSKLKCWGKNLYGNLGLDSVSNKGNLVNEMGDNLPFVDLGNESGSDYTVKKIALGSDHSCAILSNDKMKCWGHNKYGQLGQDSKHNLGDGLNSSNVVVVEMGNALSFIDLGNASGTDYTVEQLASGYAHNCAVLSNGRLKCWGYNDYGQLGQGNTNDLGDGLDSGGNAAVEMGNNLDFVDLGVDGSSNHYEIDAIVSKNNHTCAILDTDGIADNIVMGLLKCWGLNSSAQLGLGHLNTMGDGANEMGANLPFINLGTDENNNPYTVKMVVTGYSHTCALLNNNQIKCWGGNAYGQLGLGHTNTIGDEAGEVGFSFIDLGNIGVPYMAVHISAGENHTCAILNNGRLRCWGQNNYGQLGQGNINHFGDDSGEQNNNLPFIDTGSL